MKAGLSRRVLHALVIGPLLLLPVACAVTADGGYGDVGIGVDYYDPFAYDYGYGGWGPGYRVAPFGPGVRRLGAGGGGGAPQHAYRPAAAGRSMPSLPAGGRAGGGRAGGGKGR
jgi:hypothetical protein